MKWDCSIEAGKTKKEGQESSPVPEEAPPFKAVVVADPS